MTNRHSNLGDYSYLCKWNYSVVEGKHPNEYYPVLEDGNRIFIYNSKDLLETGIDSFKIEGHMKRKIF